MIEQQWDVVAPLAQRRQLDFYRVEAIEQVLSEHVFLSQPVGGQVGRADQADVDRHRAVGADRGDLAPFERGEQFGLEVKRQIADLVEEDGPAGARLEPPDALGFGVGERALGVTEQLGSNRLSLTAPRSTETIAS